MKKMRIDFQLPVSFLKEDKRFIAYTPALDLSTSGKTYEEARKRFWGGRSSFLWGDSPQRNSRRGPWKLGMEENACCLATSRCYRSRTNPSCGLTIRTFYAKDQPASLEKVWEISFLCGLQFWKRKGRSPNLLAQRFKTTGSYPAGYSTAGFYY